MLLHVQQDIAARWLVVTAGHTTVKGVGAYFFTVAVVADVGKRLLVCTQSCILVDAADEYIHMCQRAFMHS